MKSQKTLQWDIHSTNDSRVVQLTGELTRDTLLPLWEQRASFLSVSPNQPIYWDLKEIARIDSAGFTLLAELLHFYGKQTPNYVINAPQSLHTLAELYDLDHWLAAYLPHSS